MKNMLNQQIAQVHKKPTSHRYSTCINYVFEKYIYFTFGRVRLNSNFYIFKRKETGI